jgi:hypothetical protein
LERRGTGAKGGTLPAAPPRPPCSRGRFSLFRRDLQGKTSLARLAIFRKPLRLKQFATGFLVGEREKISGNREAKPR